MVYWGVREEGKLHCFLNLYIYYEPNTSDKFIVLKIEWQVLVVNIEFNIKMAF